MQGVTGHLSPMESVATPPLTQRVIVPSSSMGSISGLSQSSSGSNQGIPATPANTPGLPHLTVGLYVD